MELLYVYSSDYFKGRGTGELGQKRACTSEGHYESNNIYPAKGTNNYYQPMELLTTRKKLKPKM